MRNLLLVCVGLVVVLGVVSGNLWRELRAERQANAELRGQGPQAVVSDTGAAQVQVQAPQAAVEAKATPVVAVPIPEPKSVAPAAESAPALTPAAIRVATAAVKDALHAEVMAQAEQTATGRVLQWRDRLTIAGQTLTTAQMQALNTAAITELKREADESFATDTSVETIDAETVARMREEKINRQNETNLRILRTASSQLTAEQSEALRTLFAAGHAQRLAAAKADRERERAAHPSD